ncbi:MAG: tRNA (adenosine(37)-N6)-dimethylallyltransferase MiaA [Clostridia bacterium]|nr:tRNA (adenosine(37)-N6)-dimethylallyltransferase MiaA [Clostridia bacterium]
MDAADGRDRIRIGAIVGPTAVGKSELALAVAPAVRAEIVSIDSTAVYRGMDIGTDKPTPAARRLVPHHLLDLVDPDDTFTVARFREAADRAIRDVAARGRHPLLVGASGLHLRAVLRGFQFPEGAPTPEERRAWEEILARQGVEALSERLRALDPAAWAEVDRKNPRRLIRALERATARRRAGHPGEGPAGAAALARAVPPPYDALVVGLHMDRERLYRRIAERVERELRDGLVEEARSLLARYPADLVAFRALGYKEVIGYLRGEYDEEGLRAVLVRNTRRLAKKQYTWFRREPGILWLDVGKRGDSAIPTLVRWFDAFFASGARPDAEESDPAP